MKKVSPCPLFNNTRCFDLSRQHLIIPVAQTRRQIFRQAKKNDAAKITFRQGGWVRYEGKDASSFVTEALAVNCAALS